MPPVAIVDLAHEEHPTAHAVDQDGIAEPPRGKRDIIQLIKTRATATPNASYGSILVDENDISKGFEDISWSKFSNAIDHATHWLRRVLPEPVDPFETIGYTGPRDIRYAILIVAVAQLERKLLVPGPSLTIMAQKVLVEKTRCKFWLFAPPFEEVVRSVASEKYEWQVKVAEVPEVGHFLRDEKAERVAWTKTWEESKKTPCLVIHTSGTTGLPKPVVYTHQALMQADASVLMPEYGPEEDCYENHQFGRRWYSPLPTLHIAGVLVALVYPACQSMTIVFGPSFGVTPTNAQLSADIIRFGRCTGASFAPVFLDAFTKNPSAMEALQQLDFIYYGGAPCGRSTVKKLQSHNIRVIPGFGTSETGGLMMMREPGEDDNEFHKFRPSYGHVFEHRDGDAHEMVFYRDAKLEQWQGVFMVYPHLDRFPTGDLWVESKEKPGYWKIVGRTDDLVVFENSNKLNAIDVELRFSSFSNVTGIVVGGTGRTKPFVLVEWANSTDDDSEKLEKLWPEVERVNETLSESIQLERGLILFTKREKPLVRNIKGGPVRSRCEALYKDEIDQLYASVASGRNHKL